MKFIVLLGCLVGLATIFQNCAPYQAATNNSLTGNADAASICVGTACKYDNQSLSIQIANPEIRLSKPGVSGQSGTCDGNSNRCFDVSGYCRRGGYKTLVFFVRLDGANGFPNTQNLQAACDATGRFDVLVQLPTGYDYTTTHTAVVTMRAVDDQGALVDNPSGDNSKGVAVNAY
jgi:hypothetical protein